MRQALLAGMLVGLLPMAAHTQESVPAPDGMVLLTVAGDIAVANRGAPQFLEDPFLAFHELEFERAAAFDLAMLEALESRSAEVRLSQWPEPSRLEGPALRALLDAVGAPADAGVSFVALDGFRVELSAADIDAHDWFVAIRRDGRPLGIGAHGPAWVMFPPAAADHAATREEAQRWPWTAFFAEVVAGR